MARDFDQNLPFRDINPVAGNIGSADSPGRQNFKNINRELTAARGSARSGSGMGDWSSAAKTMLDGFKPTPEVGVVSGLGLFGRYGSINFGAAVQSILYKELDYG